MAPAEAFVATYRDPAFLATLADHQGPRHLDADFELVRETFHRFAEDQIRPRAEHIHRANTDIPEEIIAGMAEMGGFGMSVPEEYGGFATGGEADYMGMVVATEELSWGSLGAGGSLITRPEILTRALVRGGTEDQKQRWLPKLATAEVMGAVAVTEPDFGSDVAGVVTAALAHRGRLADQRREDLVHLRRPGRRAHAAGPHRPGPGQGPPRPVPVPGGEAPGRGARIPVHPTRRRRRPPAAPRPDGWRAGPSTPSATGACTPTRWPSRTGSCPTPTWWAARAGLGQGFYLQMQGFENGRLQTAARAIGVMQAAYEAALDYARNRVVFGAADRRLPADPGQAGPHGRADPGHPAVLLRGGPVDVQGRGDARGLDGQGLRVPRRRVGHPRGLQIHGGMGYAEEYPVSRYFVDARVLSIFEGADETLALKVIARRLVADARD